MPPPTSTANGGVLRSGGNGGGSDDDDGSDDSDDESPLARAREWGAPVRREVSLGGSAANGSPCAALALGTKGGCVALYDFSAMTSALRPLREIEACCEQRLQALSWSRDGQALLACPATTRAKLLDGQGTTLGETARGDMYILDMRQTVGHVASITDGAFSPADAATYATSSEDGTVRVWDAAAFLQQKMVLRPRQRNPQGRLPVTALAWAADGRSVAGGCADGSMQLWDLRQAAAVPAAVVAAPAAQVATKITSKCVARPADYHSGPGGGANEVESRVLRVRLSPDGRAMAVRREESLELWDARKLGSGPVATRRGLPTAYDSGDCAFSPDGELLAVAAAGEGNTGGGGVLRFLRAGNLESIVGVPVEGSVAPTRLEWHAALNQLALGVGARGTGGVRLLYDEEMSKGGALKCAKARKRRREAFVGDAGASVGEIFAPGAGEVPSFRGGNRASKHEAEARRPDLGAKPIVGARGSGGRVGLPQHAMLKQHILKAGGHAQGALGGELGDIRESFWRHAAQDGQGPVAQAYTKTQPKKVFSSWEDEDSDDDK